MQANRHPDSTLIDRIGSDLVASHFDLSPQRLYNWRTRGIPLTKRIAFAKLCADHGVSTPPDFFADFEQAPRAGAVAA